MRAPTIVYAMGKLVETVVVYMRHLFPHADAQRRRTLHPLQQRFQFFHFFWLVRPCTNKSNSVFANDCDNLDMVPGPFFGVEETV